MKTNLHTHYETDPTEERKGRWTFLSHTEAEFRIAYAGAGYLDAVRDECRRLGVASVDHLPESARNAVYTRALATAVLMDWRGVLDDTGEPIPYSADNGYELMRALPHLQRDVLLFANSWENYRSSTKDVMVGNSGSSSATG